MPQRLLTLVNWSIFHYWHFVTGFFFAFFSYFEEIKGNFHVMFAAFAIDLFIGILASKRIRKEKFSMTKFFVAMYRLLISVAIVMLLFANDKVTNQNTVDLANITSWLITGFLTYSVAENGYALTGGKLFLAVKSVIRKKVEDNTGISIDKLNGEMYDKD